METLREKLDELRQTKLKKIKEVEEEEKIKKIKRIDELIEILTYFIEKDLYCKLSSKDNDEFIYDDIEVNTFISPTMYCYCFLKDDDIKNICNELEEKYNFRITFCISTDKETTIKFYPYKKTDEEDERRKKYFQRLAYSSDDGFMSS